MENNRIWVLGEVFRPLNASAGDGERARVVKVTAGIMGARSCEVGDGLEVEERELVAWSGGLLDEETGETDPRTWARAGWEAMERAAEETLESGVRPILRVHAAHVLSDALSCARFLAEFGGRGARVLFDPASLMTRSMVDGNAAADLLTRFFEATGEGALGEQVAKGGLAGVVVANIQRVGEAEVRPVALQAGEMDVGLIAGLAGRVPQYVPLVVVDGDIHGQVEALHRAGVSTTLGSAPNRGIS